MPIFKELRKEGISFQILQFTWGNVGHVASTRQLCEQTDFGYQAITIWRWPLAIGALLTALMGAWHVKKAIDKGNINLVMARSTLPALSTMLALSDHQCRIMFDADGLPLDERVDFAGLSSSSLIYRLLRDIESQAVRRADVVLTRSSKAAEILLARAGSGTLKDKFYVVNNGRDVGLFKPSNVVLRAQRRRDLGLADNIPLIVYAGSVGEQYCVDEMFRFFDMIHELRSDAHFLILTGSPEAVQPVLAKHLRIHGCVTTLSVSADSVPEYLGCADLGLALRKLSFSMQAVAPIKLGEYLLCGLPVVATDGIGDTEAITTDVGLLLERMDDLELKIAVDWFLDLVLPQRESFRVKSRAVGLSQFSLDASVTSYLKAIQSLSDTA